MIDVSSAHLQIILDILKTCAPDCEVRAFGSRYRWTAKDTSDLDLAVVGERKRTLREMAALREAFEESDLPFRVDVLDWHTISPEFQQVIEDGYEVIQESELDMSSKGWRKYKLGDVVDIKHGFAFKGEFFSDEPTEYILLTPGNFKIGGGFKADKFKYYSGEVPEEYILKAHDVIVTMTDLSKDGDTLGYSALVPEYGSKKFLHNQRLGLLQFKCDDVDKHFVYWLLRTKLYQVFIVNTASGTTVKHTSPSRIKEFEFEAPDLLTQRRIASILSALDDKIEINRQTNATLEAIAQGIFKEWFVDFNFPGATGELVESEVGMIPPGWQVGSILEIADLLSGGTPNSQVAEYWDGEIQWVSAKDVSNSRRTFILDTERKITGIGIANSNTKILPKLTTIITARGTVGNYCILAKPMAMNQTNYGLKAKVNNADYFLLFSVGNLIGHLKQAAYGTIFDTITTKTFEQSRMIIPPTLLTQKFDLHIAPIMQSVLNTLEESTILTELRNTLLQKLMFGEIEI
jgi:type I restriction enzyme, S subunit